MRVADEPPRDAEELTISLQTLLARSERLVEGFESVERRLRMAGKDDVADVVARQITRYELFQDVDVTQMSHRELEDFYHFMEERLDSPPGVAI